MTTPLAQALANTAGQLFSLLALQGAQSVAQLMLSTGKSERCISDSLAKLSAANLVQKSPEGLWITVDNCTDFPKNGAEFPKNSDIAESPSRKNGAEFPKNCTEFPKNNDMTSHARGSSSSSKNKKKERGVNDEKRTAVRQLLHNAGVAWKSAVMFELLDLDLSLDYVQAHIADSQRQNEPVGWLIQRLRTLAPQPDCWWLQEAVHEIDGTAISPHSVIPADTAINNDMDGRPTPPKDPELFRPLPQSCATWKDALSELQLQMTRATFNTWLKDTIGVEVGGRLVLIVRNEYAQDWVANRLIKGVKCTYRACGGTAPDIEVVTVADWRIMSRSTLETVTKEGES